MVSVSLPLPGTAPVPRDAVPARDPAPDAAWEECTRPVAGREGWLETWLSIEGMYCAACTFTIEQAIGAVPGVDSVQVNGGTATARVVWSPSRCARREIPSCSHYVNPADSTRGHYFVVKLPYD